MQKNFLLILMAGLLTLVGCGDGGSGADGSGQIIKIGHVAPLTGPISHLGKDNERGAQLAIDEANAAGITIGGEKVEFRLLSEDDEANPQKGTVVAQKLVDSGVAGVIGHLNSGTTIPASKIYHDAGLAQISPSATAIMYTHQGYKTAFRVMANDEQQGKVLGDYAVKTIGAKKIAVIDDRSAYGKGLADEFEKAAKSAGGEVVTREFTETTKTDFTAILTKIKGLNPDVIFYGGMDAQAGPMMKQVKNLGITATYLSGDGIQSKQFLVLAGEEGEGAYASSPGLPLEKMDGGKSFQEKFLQTYHEDIQIYAPFTYDATSILIDAMVRADSSNPESYLPLLSQTDYQGVTGQIRFDENGDLRGGSISLYRVKNGEWEYIETVGGE